MSPEEEVEERSLIEDRNWRGVKEDKNRDR